MTTLHLFPGLQSPWIIDGQRKGVSSVEERIADAVLPAFQADRHKFMSAGMQPSALQVQATFSCSLPASQVPTVIIHYLLSVVCCLLSVVCCLLSVVCCLLSVICYLLSVACCLLSVICVRSSVICYLLSVFRHPSSVICHLSYVISSLAVMCNSVCTTTHLWQLLLPSRILSCACQSDVVCCGAHSIGDLDMQLAFKLHLPAFGMHGQEDFQLQLHKAGHYKCYRMPQQ